MAFDAEVVMPASMLCLALCAFVVAGAQGGGAKPRRDLAKFNVCEAMPGDVIARALNGKLVNARPFMDKSVSRCTYFVIPARAEQQRGYVVWIQPPEDFEELKKYVEEPRTDLSGLGDAAYMFHDKGDGRFKINVLKRGDMMYQATGESAETARKVADAVAAHLWKGSPTK